MKLTTNHVDGSSTAVIRNFKTKLFVYTSNDHWHCKASLEVHFYLIKNVLTKQHFSIINYQRMIVLHNKIMHPNKSTISFRASMRSKLEVNCYGTVVVFVVLLEFHSTIQRLLSLTHPRVETRKSKSSEKTVFLNVRFNHLKENLMLYSKCIVTIKGFF